MRPVRARLEPQSSNIVVELESMKLLKDRKAIRHKNRQL